MNTNVFGFGILRQRDIDLITRISQQMQGIGFPGKCFRLKKHK